MNAQNMAAALGREDSLAHVKAAGWGRGVNALVRIARMTLRHPWQSGAAIGATFVASALQLTIPRLLGHAVDQTQAVVTGGGGAAGGGGGALDDGADALRRERLPRPLHHGAELLRRVGRP